MRHSLLALLASIASLAFAGAASATFTRVADTGGVGYNTSWCSGPNCYFWTTGSGPVDLEAPSDSVDFSYLGGELHLRTTFEPERIHTEFDGTRFDMSQPPCGGCYWNYFPGGAGTRLASRSTTFAVSDPTAVRLYGGTSVGDLIVLAGPGGTIFYSYETIFDETFLLDPGQYRLDLLMPENIETIFDDAGGERVTLEVVPEPGTLALFGVGLAVLAVARRSRRHASSAR